MILALDALSLRDRIAAGALKAVDVSEAYLAQIAAREPQIRAFAHLDPDFVRLQARACDAHRATGRPLGPLHGVPVALKDIIDTARMPTRRGTARDADRVPMRDAFVTAALRSAGAVILGKTVTTELAFLDPPATRNPHDPARSPGGSSSGSAAAVAAAMAPLAVGTQTGGSVIRPASFCGVTGFKPSFGTIPRTGILPQSATLDTVGVFARSPADAALLADAIAGHDPDDHATAPAPGPQMLAGATAPPPVTPSLALLRPPGWDRADAQMRHAIEELARALGDNAEWISLPDPFHQAEPARRRINLTEMAHAYRPFRRGGDSLGPQLRAAIDEGAGITALDYLAALDWRPVLRAGIDEILTRFDAILTPAALGPAPLAEDGTGDAIFNGLWTLTGHPVVTIPVFTGAEGLPMGLQGIGALGHDARLLRTASWLMDHLSDDTGERGDG